ncbi:MAG: Crp/Fnr family transcriptional regulator [Bacteroidia bacterium]|nr:Crp/Fnr family transcriptional regulator [Bacteroidia bacterium]
MQTTTDLIRSHFPMLREPELIAAIERHSTYKFVPAGEPILEPGSYIHAIPLLLTGSIKVLREDDDGNELLLYYFYAGESCAMSLTCCVGEEVSAVRALAEDDCELLMIPAQYVDSWMTQYRSWKSFVMQTYRRRLEQMLETLDSIAFQKLDERLWKYLRDRTGVAGNPVLQATHQQIADDLHTSREVVSRLLKQLERRKQVRLGRNRVEVVG